MASAARGTLIGCPRLADPASVNRPSALLVESGDEDLHHSGRKIVRHSSMLSALAAMSLMGVVGGEYPSRRRNIQDLTLEELEDLFVQTKMRQLAEQRYREERARRRAEELAYLDELVRLEELRPKSRQELRAKERSLPNHYTREHTTSREKSPELRALLARKPRRGRL